MFRVKTQNQSKQTETKPSQQWKQRRQELWAGCKDLNCEKIGLGGTERLKISLDCSACGLRVGRSGHGCQQPGRVLGARHQWTKYVSAESLSRTGGSVRPGGYLAKLLSSQTTWNRLQIQLALSSWNNRLPSLKPVSVFFLVINSWWFQKIRKFK